MSEAKPEKAAASAPDAPTSEPRARRERKQADFFTPDGPKGDGQKRAIPEGKGTKLSDIPNVAFHFTKVKGGTELVESIHSLLFKSKGKLSTRKRDIMAFSGFAYEDETERGKHSEKLEKWKLDDIHKFMDLLDMPRGSGDKKTKVSSVMDFLEKPEKLSDTDKAEKASKAKEKKAKAKEKADKAAEKKTAKKEKEVAKKEKASAAATKTPAKKGASKAAAQKDEAGPSTTKRKAAAKDTPRKRTKKNDGEAAKAEEGAAEGPSDEELKKEVEGILDSAGENFSMKDLLAKLQETHKMSFQKRKPFLKEVTSEYLGKKQAGKAEEAPEEAAAEEEAKDMETEADAAAEQPKEEVEAGEPAANGAIAAPMDEDAKEPAGDAAAEAAAPEAGDVANETSAAVPEEAAAAEPDKKADGEPQVPADDTEVPQVTAGEMPALAAAQNGVGTAAEMNALAAETAAPGLETAATTDPAAPGESENLVPSGPTA
ncbi:g5495 [Coccomyxa viridis]|uniref:G5495 protein n=1 Tax=Coccomyxa viridis TaxID=1274662 RepID=A0ABP1FSZ6_9CHLO